MGCHLVQLSVCTAWRKGLRRVWDLPFQTHSRLIHRFVSCYQSERDFCSAVCTLLTSACPVRTVLFVLYHIMVFSSGTCSLPLVLMLFFVVITCTSLTSHICRINKQYVWFAHKQKVILPKFDKINVIKELLNVKYDFASLPVLDLADNVYSIELLCIE